MASKRPKARTRSAAKKTVAPKTAKRAPSTRSARSSRSVTTAAIKTTLPFKLPQSVGKSLEALTQVERKRMIARLIPRPEPAPPPRVATLIRALEPPIKRFHGTRVPLRWFPEILITSPCANKFGYMFPVAVRTATRLPFSATTQALLNQLGNLMGDPARDSGVDSTIPAGYTYFGQFVDHDITFDTSSTIDASQDATTITNMRTPALDLDSVYGQGPALDPYLYRFPAGTMPPTAVKLQLGRNRDFGNGGPRNGSGVLATPTTFDVPRVLNGTEAVVTPGESTFTAIIGDPRNDENVIVSQLHHAILKFHNRVVDLLITAAFAGDIFAEAKRITTHHYQWCVIHDFLVRICGATAVNSAIASATIAPGSAFSMPVEFAVAAYRFGHSLIRNGYILNSSLPPAQSSLKGIFDFIRVPLLPLFSNWAVDFNMFFNTGRPVPGSFNNARKIDSVLASGLEQIPGGSGITAILATRNLRRGLALGLPSGQGAAGVFGITPLTEAELTSGLQPDEVNLLNSNNKLLLKKTPLWYYVLREAAVVHGGNQLGPVGGRIVADTFVRMLKRDRESFMNVPGFSPSLPSSVSGQFMISDLLEFAGVLIQ